MHKLVNGERVEVPVPPEAREPEKTVPHQVSKAVTTKSGTEKAAKIPKGKPMPLRAKLRTAKGNKSGK